MSGRRTNGCSGCNRAARLRKQQQQQEQKKDLHASKLFLKFGIPIPPKKK